MGGDGQREMDGERELELEWGKGKRRRAVHDKREERTLGLFLLSKRWGRGVVCGDVCGGWAWNSSARMEGMLKFLHRVLVMSPTPRLGYTFQLEPHHYSAPLGPLMKAVAS
jgi:hypothetical protein